MNDIRLSMNTIIAPKNASGGGIRNIAHSIKNIKLPMNGIGRKPIKNTSMININSCSVSGIAYIINIL